MSVKSNNLVPMTDSVQTLKGRLNVRAPLDGQGSTAPTVIKVNQINKLYVSMLEKMFDMPNII